MEIDWVAAGFLLFFLIFPLAGFIGFEGIKKIGRWLFKTANGQTTIAVVFFLVIVGVLIYAYSTGSFENFSNFPFN